MILFEKSRILCANVVIASNQYTIRQSNLYSLCKVVCNGKAMKFQYLNHQIMPQKKQKHIRTRFILFPGHLKQPYVFLVRCPDEK